VISDDLAQVQETGRLPRLSERERRRAVSAVPVPEPGRYLAVESGDEVVVIPLEGAVTRLGRSLSADVHLDEPSVSRRHALVVLRGDDVVVLDDRSMNGTRVNGKRVREAVLHDGDVVELGSVRVRFVDVPQA
jgi:pSer/pThr/pTyr-binding forkhead associated (FHA) protein